MRRLPRPTSARLIAAVVIMIGSATICLISACAAPMQQVGQPVPAAVPGQDQLSRGRQLYGSSCAGCHGQQGQGTGQAPSLIGVGTADVDYMLASGRMPLTTPDDRPKRQPPAYSASDRAALVAYIASLGAGGPSVPRLPAGNIAAGRDLYLTNCAACHGSGADGGVLPGGQTVPRLHGVPDEQIAEAMRVGPGLMPQFAQSDLSDKEAADIVAYIQDMPNHASRGGWALGGLGPAAEGLVGWGLGLGTLLVVIRLLGKKAPK